MTDEPLTQADQFLEHAIRDESLAAQLRNADFATVARIANGLGYVFTEEEFSETLDEYTSEQLDDAMLELVVGGIGEASDDDDDDGEDDDKDVNNGKNNIGTVLQNVAKEEARHYVFYREIFLRVLARDPNRALESAALIMRLFNSAVRKARKEVP